MLPGYQHLISRDVVTVNCSWEILRPLLYFAGFDVRPVEMWLEIAVMAGYIANLNREEHMSVVRRPMKVVFDGLIMCDLMGWPVRRRICQVNRIDFEFAHLLLALGNRSGHERELAAIQRGNDLLYPPGRVGQRM